MPQPLSEDEKADIRLFLGYQSRFHQLDSALEFAMRAVDESSNLASVAVYDQITRPLADPAGPGILALIKDIDAKIKAADPLVGVNKAGSIGLDPTVALGLLRSRGRSYVGRLSAILGVPVRWDYFSGTHPRGPFWGVAGQVYGSGNGGGGNLPPLG